MSEPDLTHHRQRLLALKKELEAMDANGSEGAETVELDQARMGRLSRMDALQSQQMAQASVRRRREMLQRIEGALRRLDNGDYGLCFVCDDEIGEARLNVDPTATRCIDCVDSD